MKPQRVIVETISGPKRAVLLAPMFVPGSLTRWVRVRLTQNSLGYPKDSELVTSWDNIWLKHKYTEGGAKSLYEGKPRWPIYPEGNPNV